MRLKFVTLIAALFFVAACTTASEELADTGGEGAATTTSTAGVTTGPATDDDDGATEEDTQVAARTPPGIVAGSQQDLIANVGDRVFFDFDKFDIQSDAQRVLNLQADWLKANRQTSITIEGHADQRGTREYNLALGERRATSVKNFLVALGINENRITVISFGKERPVALGSNDTAWAQNRRGVTVVN
jgi:peptidoglycan-associated lipoprotein